MTGRLLELGATASPDDDFDVELIGAGFDPHTERAWEAVFPDRSARWLWREHLADAGAVEAASWRDAHVTATDAKGWRQRGFTIATAAEWFTAGFEFADAGVWREYHVSVDDALELTQSGVSAEAYWSARRHYEHGDTVTLIRMGIDSVAPWVSRGFTGAETIRWFTAGMSPTEAKNWRNFGAGPEDAAWWRERFPSEPRLFPQRIAGKLIPVGINERTVDEWLEAVGPGELSMDELVEATRVGLDGVQDLVDAGFVLDKRPVAPAPPSDRPEASVPLFAHPGTAAMLLTRLRDPRFEPFESTRILWFTRRPGPVTITAVYGDEFVGSNLVRFEQPYETTHVLCRDADRVVADVSAMMAVPMATRSLHQTIMRYRCGDGQNLMTAPLRFTDDVPVDRVVDVSRAGA